MIICICNALKETQVCNAIESGASCPLSVMGKLGCKPKCGKCLDEVKDIISSTIDMHNLPQLNA